MARKHKVFTAEMIEEIKANAEKIKFVEIDNRIIDGEEIDDRVLSLKEELYRRYECFQEDHDEEIVPIEEYVPGIRELHDIETDIDSWVYRQVSVCSTDGVITKVECIAY